MTSKSKRNGNSERLKEVTAIEAGFSTEERRLQEWLAKSSEQRLRYFLDELEDCWNNDVVTIKWFEDSYPRKGKLSPAKRREGAMLLVHELRQYSGHSLNFFTEKPHYEEIVTRIHKRICSKQKSKFPEIASVAQREDDITRILMGDALSKLSDEEVAGALSGSDIRSSSESARKKFERHFGCWRGGCAL